MLDSQIDSDVRRLLAAVNVADSAFSGTKADIDEVRAVIKRWTLVTVLSIVVTPIAVMLSFL